jgi:glyoxylase-like metal-dependent hydrolase (beta-lactamase superfamily II)
VKIETVTSRLFQANAFVVVDDATSRCCIIDSGEDGAGIEEAVERLGATVELLLLTHGHLDHIGGLARLKRAFPEAPVVAPSADAPLFERAVQQGAMFGVRVEAPPPIEQDLGEGQEVTVGEGIRFRVLETPGHSPGGVVFYAAESGVAFVGDTIFQGSVGRVDLPGGDGRTLLTSIREKILTLPDDTKLYCGHGPPTTVAFERRHNPFLQEGVRLD